MKQVMEVCARILGYKLHLQMNLKPFWVEYSRGFEYSPIDDANERTLNNFDMKNS